MYCFLRVVEIRIVKSGAQHSSRRFWDEWTLKRSESGKNTHSTKAQFFEKEKVDDFFCQIIAFYWIFLENTVYDTKNFVIEVGCPYFSSPGWEEVLILKPYFTHPQKCALFGGANWGCTRVQKVVHLDFENWGVRKNDKTVLLSIVGANYDSFLNKKNQIKHNLTIYI